MRKSILMFFIATLFSFTLSAKDIAESNVPVAVKGYVSKNYPAAVDKEWKYKNKYNKNFYYEVDFEVGGRDVELQLSPSGKLLRSEEELLIKDAPSFVGKYIQDNYSGAKILGVKRKIKSNMTTYDVGISFSKNGNTRYRNIYFDSKGNVIKQ